MLLVHGSSINKSLGKETKETFESLSTNTIKMTSALSPLALPLLWEELGLLSSLPITKYDVNKLSILVVLLFTSSWSYTLVSKTSVSSLPGIVLVDVFSLYFHYYFPLEWY